MSKLFAYRHEGAGGCNKTAFFTLSRPKPGETLADGVVIKTDGTRARQIGALMCGSCGNGVLGLKTAHLKPARPSQMVDLVVKAVNAETMASAEVQVVTENLTLMHELCSKIDKTVIPYVGSGLEQSVKELIGDTGSVILDAGGKSMEAANA